MQTIEALLAQASDLVWGPPLLILLFGTHLFLTVRLRFIQRYLPKAIRLSFSREKEGDGDISQFGALTTALAATIGFVISVPLDLPTGPAIVAVSGLLALIAWLVRRVRGE